MSNEFEFMPDFDFDDEFGDEIEGIENFMATKKDPEHGPLS